MGRHFVSLKQNYSLAISPVVVVIKSLALCTLVSCKTVIFLLKIIMTFDHLCLILQRDSQFEAFDVCIEVLQIKILINCLSALIKVLKTPKKWSFFVSYLISFFLCVHFLEGLKSLFSPKNCICLLL